ncbi:hypothetical protein HGA92_03245 [Candidatus Gracilibacteria bacterium]|nr:hypothetical protein [Candidatus Gracilibacteria bacterium]NUJ99113.1 hypothetical protein [Candidatus Gracilibacteria bacterium]
MQLYTNKSGKLEQVKEIGFKLEKEMQELTEHNLENIFGLEFIKSEFSLNNLRIDTLAFDNENNCFVIIEFKRGSSYSVIDQGFSYLSMLLNNKANFVHELGKKRNKFIDMGSMDWSQSKVIFIADSFTRYQKESINFKDLPIELYEMKQFNNGTIIYNSILATNTTESIKTITKLETEFKEVNKEIQTYDENYHISSKDKNIIDIYEEFKNFTISINNSIDIVYRKKYITFRANRKNFLDIIIGKGYLSIRLHLKKGEDIYGINSEKKLDFEYDRTTSTKQDFLIIKIKNDKDLLIMKELIKQTYDKLNK